MEIVKPIKLVRKITREQLSQILKRHKLWLTGYPQGMRADLSHMDLSGFDLRRVNLCSADLDGANLSYADLRGANLDAVRLGNVNLEGAKLDDYFVSLRLSQNNEHMLVYNVTKNIIWYGNFKGSLEEFDARRNEIMQADSEIDKQDCLNTVAYLETMYKLHKSFDVKPVRVIKRIKIGK